MAEASTAASDKKSQRPSTYRHYCCVCSNYRGKEVEGKSITLHRFPATKSVQKTWLQRIRSVRPNFQFSEKNDRLCSAHFRDGTFVAGKTLPSVFRLNDGRLKTFGIDIVTDEENDKHDNSVPSVETSTSTHGDFAEGYHEDSTVFSFDGSYVHASAMLHDYCGEVGSDTFGNYSNKNEQTDIPQNVSDCSTQTECIKTNFRSVCCQTEETFIPDKKSVGIQVTRPDLTIEDIDKSDEKCMFYTGVPNVNTFKPLFDELNDAEEHTHRMGCGDNSGRPRILRLIDEFFLVLMRLRLGLLLEDLADRFHISKSTCSYITSHWMDYLHVKFSFLLKWPTKTVIEQTMPNKFKSKYPDCRVIIDCTEVFTQNPQSQSNKSLMYSHYKTHMTYKALLGISPSGVITFVSDLWSGSISYKQLTERCGMLDLCESGDSIMADKGFLISDLTTPRGIKLIIPPFKRTRFNRRQVEETRRIANLRIDVERAMERVKNFRILQGVMPITIAKQASKIWKICAALSNLQPSLVHDEED